MRLRNRILKIVCIRKKFYFTQLMFALNFKYTGNLQGMRVFPTKFEEKK